jgi:tetratricopeptide (TPR) repeat protein
MSTQQNIQEIGEKLGVRTILEGSIQKEANEVRIIPKLINTPDGSLIWSEKYIRELDNVFVIQDDIALAIVHELKVNLLGEEREELTKHHTENVKAYEAYLMGRYFWRTRTKEGLEKALDYFQESLDLEPSYALGYAGLADAYNLLGYYGHMPADEAWPKAKDSALRALGIDNTIAEAHATLGWIKFNDWDWVGAGKDYSQAIELNPGYSTAHHWKAMLLLWLARYEEAIKEIEIALELDPFSPAINRDAGMTYLFAGQYDQAIEFLNKSIELEAKIPWVHSYLGLAYSLNSMHKEALSEFSGNNFWEHFVYALMGEKQKALDWVDKNLEEMYYRHPVFVALFYGVADDAEKTFHFLEKAYEAKDIYIGFMNLRFFRTKYKTDPRFIALTKKIGIE